MGTELMFVLQINNAMGGAAKEVEKDWGLGGLLLLGDQPDGKAAGTMIWGGLPNLIWVSYGSQLFVMWC